MRKQFILLILLLFPINVFAYSNYLIVNGDPIGIEIHSNGVYIVGFYNEENKAFHKGDKIISINNQNISSIEDLNKNVTKEGIYKTTIKRNNKEIELNLNVNEKIQTGLYVKDEVDGVGTLSYIDPETKIFATLGHEILESSSNTIFDLKNGYLHDVEIKYINKSKDGLIGEYHANFKNQLLGNINKNQINGIYGKYTETTDTSNLKEVGKKDEITKGKASILLNIDIPTEYEINILSIDDKEEVKNIYFEITDKSLLEKTGGVVQGMSGSPIIQNNKIIGVVNYVVVNDSEKGYGIYIEKMLEEGDKLLKD